MNKKIVVAVVSFVVLAVGGVVYVSSQPADRKMYKNPDSPTQQVSDTQIVMKGSYVEYSADVVANTPGTKVLFFHASWCPQCRAIEADIKRESVPAGLTIIKVDYDSHQDLRKKYGVTLQTTFIKIDDSGNAIADKYVAYNEPTFAAVKRDYL